MSLRDRISAWRMPSGLGEFQAKLATAVAATDVKRALTATPVSIPGEQTLDQVYNFLLEAHRNGQWEKLPKRALRLSPWVILEKGFDKTPLITEPGFIGSYVDVLKSTSNVRTAINLVYSLLLNYDRQDPGHERLRATVRDILRTSGSGRAKFFLEKAERFGLIQHDGPDRFVSAFLNDRKSAREFIAEAGLSGRLEFEGFLETCFVKIASAIGSRLAQGELDAHELDRIAAIAIVEDGGHDNWRFRLSQLQVLVEALLLPFQSKEPEHGVRKWLEIFVLDCLGDPRLTPEKWNGVNEHAERVIRRWLVAATLGDFFRVLDESMRRGTDADADRHWPYRRAFWNAYLERDHISDAWVVLGHSVAKDTRHVLSEMSASYARLERGGGARHSHAVLIMRIGSLIITEWSHSGKYRIWNEGNPNAPEFYRKRYHRDELVYLPDFEGAHHGAVTGTWQSTLAGVIKDHTGVHIGLRQLMPRN